jgi:dTDP-4-amino-4,6-dideoxygalactose transaminase
VLPELDGWSAGRRAAGQAYVASGLGEHVTLPRIPDGAEPAWHLYVVAHPSADGLIAALRDSDIQARGYYRTPVHLQPAMRAYSRGAQSLPATEELAATNLALPMSPRLREHEAQAVTAAIAAASMQ